MFKDMLKKLSHEFGFLKEDIDSNIEQDVLNKLDRSAKLDEVDTVTFGLETDDNKVVKVYVKVEDADDFEKALSEKLGEVDDIEEALNQLAKEFEIVDVEWPEEQTASDDEEEQEDGSEVLNKKVYDQAREQQAKDAQVKPKVEESIGDQLTAELTEASAQTIETRFTTATQLMVYQAIIELGVPEIALTKSAYRATIIKNIKEKAIELQTNAAMKNSLKTFINRSIDFDKKAEANRKGETEQQVKEEIIVEGVTDDFWTSFDKIINHLSDKPENAAKLLDNTYLKQIRNKSVTALSAKLPTMMRKRLTSLRDSIDKSPSKMQQYAESEVVTEATNATEVESLITDLLKLADTSKDGRLANNFMSSTAWRTFFNQVKPHLSQKFNGMLRTKLNALKLSSNVTSSAANPVVQEAEQPKPKQEAEFSQEDDLLKIKVGSVSVSLNDEETEKLVKGLTNKDTVIVKDDADPTYKVAFSPRGLSVSVKKVGTTESTMMNSKQVAELLELVSKGEPEETESEADVKAPVDGKEQK